MEEVSCKAPCRTHSWAGNGVKLQHEGSRADHRKTLNLGFSPEVWGQGLGPSYLGRGEAFSAVGLEDQQLGLLQLQSCTHKLLGLISSGGLESLLHQAGRTLGGAGDSASERAPGHFLEAKTQQVGRQARLQGQVCEGETRWLPDRRAALKGGGIRLQSRRRRKRRRRRRRRRRKPC